MWLIATAAVTFLDQIPVTAQRAIVKRLLPTTRCKPNVGMFFRSPCPFQFLLSSSFPSRVFVCVWMCSSSGRKRERERGRRIELSGHVPSPFLSLVRVTRDVSHPRDCCIPLMVLGSLCVSINSRPQSPPSFHLLPPSIFIRIRHHVCLPYDDASGGARSGANCHTVGGEGDSAAVVKRVRDCACV